LRDKGFAAVVSGAGPSILVLGDELTSGRLPDPGPEWVVLGVEVAGYGAREVPLPAA
jgi:homoserine kinase